MSGSAAEPIEAGDHSAELHDTAYVKALLGCSIQKVYSLVESGQLSAYKIGYRSLRFSDEQINSFLASREVSV